MDASYKSLKEDFVSNLTGGSITEINYTTAVAPVAVCVWSIFQSRQSLFVRYGSLAFAVDFLLNIGAILLSITLYSSNAFALSLLLLVPSLFTYLVPGSHSIHKTKRPWSLKSERVKPEPLDDLPMKPFMATYRGCMMVITCLAILAVDFKIFPRRFAKVENWGTSLMDLGVGSFVFAAGVVAARPLLKERTSKRKGSLSSRLQTSARHALPLFVLGVVRLYSVKGLDYAEHVTEYGVHWNFFFTLAVLPPFVAVFQTAFSVIPSFAVLAVLLGAAYQIALEYTGLKAFILTAPRLDLLSKNREGVFSFLGYLAIFLAGQGVGMDVLPRRIRHVGSQDGRSQRMRLLVTLCLWSLAWIVSYLLTTNYQYGLGLTASRRLANLPYVLWIAAFNTCQLTAFCALETVFFPAFHEAADKAEEQRIYKFATSPILAAYNRNGLAVFLLANLMTGLVNLTIPTLHVSDVTAMGVLLVYAVSVTGVAIMLDMYDISIKL